MVKFRVGKKDELEKEVANRMAEVIKSKSFPRFILATGNSPVGVYKNLIRIHRDEGLSFRDLITYNLDEYRNIEKFQDDSFRKFMNDNLFNHIDINKLFTYFPERTKDYDRALDRFDKFDFTILGVGTNGHIAFNEPGTPIDSRTHEVSLTQSTIESNFPGRDSYPTKAVTMGLHDIYNKSSEIALLAWGEGKREALNKLASGSTDNDCPITHFYKHPNITIYTDLDGFDK